MDCTLAGFVNCSLSENQSCNGCQFEADWDYTFANSLGCTLADFMGCHLGENEDCYCCKYGAVLSHNFFDSCVRICHTSWGCTPSDFKTAVVTFGAAVGELFATVFSEEMWAAFWFELEIVTYIRCELLLPVAFCLNEKAVVNPSTATLGLQFIAELFKVIVVASRSFSIMSQTVFARKIRAMFGMDEMIIKHELVDFIYTYLQDMKDDNNIISV